MPEAQNVWGDNWQQQFNKFLGIVLKWQQLGASNTDIVDPNTNRPRGLDSVFSYKRNTHSAQQVILVEVKSTENLQYLNKSKIQEWITTLFSKLERLPRSKDFQEKFQPETDAQFQLALLGLWVRDEHSYSASKLSEWFSQVHLPQRNMPYYITLISNDTITRLISIHEEIERLRHSDQYDSIEYFIPDYGNLPSCDGNCLPLEMIFSKFIFCKARKRQKLKGNNNSYNLYDASIVFYLGSLKSYDDLRLVGLALRHFQLLKTQEVEIYTLNDPTEIRNEIANFKKDFYPENGQDEIKFDRLVPRNQMPSWSNTE